MTLSNEQIERYARHIILHEVGGIGQERLLASKVLVIGAGGLGSPLVMYLAAAGVGRIGLVDDDTVSLSNLQRQILHASGDLGRAKVESATDAVRRINPDVDLVAHQTRLVALNVMELIQGYDIVADGSDNFETRFLVNDACYLAGKTLVSAAIMRFDGQISTYKAHLRRAGDEAAHPCYRCVFGSQPEDPKESCADVGVLGALPGTLGALQATEVIKELLGIGDSLSGRLILYDALAASFHTVAVKPDPACALCGPQATIRDLTSVDYREEEPFCAA